MQFKDYEKSNLKYFNRMENKENKDLNIIENKSISKEKVSLEENSTDIYTFSDDEKTKITNKDMKLEGLVSFLLYYNYFIVQKFGILRKKVLLETVIIGSITEFFMKIFTMI